jgi:hypothetical protein
MTFLIQFKRFRRGVPEVIGTLPIAAIDGAAALASARSLAGMRRWPARTDALRVMDDGGRTLLDWTGQLPPRSQSHTSPPVFQRSRPAANCAQPCQLRQSGQNTALPRPPWAVTFLLWDNQSLTQKMVSPRAGRVAMRSSGSMTGAKSHSTRSEAQISRMTGSSMSTNSARTWAPESAAVETPARIRVA